jgi:hypothetical protein
MRRLLVLLAITCLVPFAQAQKWSFVVAGDGRADKNVERDMDKNGVNVLITGEIAQAVLAEKAKLLLWTGDLAYGYNTADEFETQLLTWRGLMQPLYDKKIPVLPCRGNHDAGAKESAEVWTKIFAGPYALPQNGPDGEKSMTYYYGKGNVLIVSLDQYAAAVKETINQPWLDGVLSSHKKPFIFTFAHEPAFMDGSHKDTMDAHTTERDAFWQSLIKAGSRVFFCGHDHLYDHMKVTKAEGAPGPELHQYVAGTSGAPFYKEGAYAGVNTIWKCSRVKHIDNTYGYLLVTIDGRKCTITFKGRVAPGKYVPMDTWSYTVK